MIEYFSLSVYWMQNWKTDIYILNSELQRYWSTSVQLGDLVYLAEHYVRRVIITTYPSHIPGLIMMYSEMFIDSFSAYHIRGWNNVGNYMFYN